MSTALMLIFSSFLTISGAEQMSTRNRPIKPWVDKKTRILSKAQLDAHQSSYQSDIDQVHCDISDGFTRQSSPEKPHAGVSLMGLLPGVPQSGVPVIFVTYRKSNTLGNKTSRPIGIRVHRNTTKSPLEFNVHSGKIYHIIERYAPVKVAFFVASKIADPYVKLAPT
uniref:Uncharacterized protein n=1 Tax=Romanomermis culicivorax TaxID=13658 RepID=A0A915JHI8_ROMCU